MPDYRDIEERFRGVLESNRRPVAISFTGEPPDGVQAFQGSQPSSCSFWRLAASGRVFYTRPDDHRNCPIGAYTHRTLSPERMPELEQTLALMSGIGYVRMEEIPGIFRLPEPPGAVVYAPLAETPVAPDVVLASGKPGRVMILNEAAARAGAAASLPLLGRPTCAAVPAALARGAVSSAACIGNRVYTEIGDDEMYVMLPGSRLEAIAAEIETLMAANATLRRYHEDRLRTLTVL